MAYETIIVEVEDYVALIRLNRPEALNALNAQVMSELAEAFTAAQNNEKVRCIVLTGSEKAFALTKSHYRFPTLDLLIVDCYVELSIR